MAEFEEKAKQSCAEVKADSYITSQPKVEKELDTKKNEEHQKNSRDVQQVMSLTVEEGNQGHSEGEHRECFKDPGMKNEKTDEQDKDTGVKLMEKNHEQEEKTIEHEAKTCELKENAVKEGEVTVDRNASHGEKNDKQEEKNIKADGKIAEFEKEKSHVEEGNQGHSESEKHRECFKEPCLKNEEREEQDEDKVGKQMEQCHEQEENTRDPGEKKSELTENSLEEGVRNIEVLKKNASEDEKNDEPEERNVKIDGKIAEGEKEKSQGDEEETRDPRQQSSEVVNNGVEEGEMNVEPEKKETIQDKNDSEQAEKTEAVERSAETSKVKNKRFYEKQPFKKAKYFTIQTGNTRDSHKEFLKCLHERKSRLKRTDKAEKCKFILVFCPVVSRAGTDIEAALHQLNEISGNSIHKNKDTKPAVLVVLHCTNDPECVVPDSSRAVNRENMITVDCLFHEDNGLHKCLKNKEAVHEVIQWLKTKPWRNAE
ncbi:uncharacterized protein DDB_G0283697-like [Pangasianodon hypophthalmus]|uniref:uncharacterized protein DDB_G0283697-like n=1 Tax=Pangasianodon hypophthalmus TaxID=310915 RepID=UPI000EFE45AA|nr:uncharacterized protein DDB_G0283697-like [Pangasianodon hypophthalmus]